MLPGTLHGRNSDEQGTSIPESDAYHKAEIMDGWNIEIFIHARREDRIKGIAGKAVLEDVSEKFLPYLFAAELLHIGKNTSMGFGKYTVKAIDE